MRSLILALLSLCLGLPMLHASHKDSLLHLQFHRHYSKRVAYLQKQAMEVAKLSVSSAFDLLDQAMEQAQRDQSHYERAAILLTRGLLTHAHATNPEEHIKGIMALQKVIPIYENLRDYSSAAIVHVELANQYGNLSLNNKALKSYLRALVIYQILENRQAVLPVYQQILPLLIKIGDYDRAEQYAQEGMAYIEREDNPHRTIFLNYLGEIYLFEEDPSIARGYFVQALQRIQQAQKPSRDGVQLPTIYNNLARTYELSASYERALTYLKKAEKLAKERNLFAVQLESYMGQARIYEAQGKIEEAELLLNESIRLARTGHMENKLIELYDQLYRLCRKTGQVDQAFTYLDERDRLRDRNQPEYLAINDIELNLQAKLARNLWELEEEKNRKQRQLNFITVIGLLSFAAFLYYLFVDKKRVNKVLEKQVEDRTRELSHANEELMHLNDELDQFAYKTTHDIRGPVARLLGLCQLALEHEREAAMNYLDLIHQEALKMDDMLHRFLDINNIKHWKYEAQDISLKPLLEGVVNEVKHEKEMASHLAISIQTSDIQQLHIDPRPLRLVCRNLIENAVDFQTSDPHLSPRLSILAFRRGDKLVISFTDNGIGIRQEVVPHIFDMFYRGHTRSQGLGLGLYGAALAAEKMEGEVVYLHDPGRTIFHLIVPFSPKNS